MIDVTALGELLIDFAYLSTDETGYPTMAAHPGGAPANFLAALAGFGAKTALLGKVGADAFGKLLVKTLEQAGIETRGLVQSSGVFTTLAFVTLDESGDREFSFARKPGADTRLTFDELDLGLIDGARVFHFGSLSMTHDGVRRATRKAIKCAKAGGALLSFDPNLRQPLWESLDEAREQIEYGLTQSDILKIADNELEFMTGETDFDKGAAILREKHPNIRLFNVTAGADGSYSYYEDKRVFVPACKLGGTIETTGAGDTFCAGGLSFVLERGLEGLTEADLTEMLRFANTAAYIVTTRKGAIRSMPEREQVLALLREN